MARALSIGPGSGLLGRHTQIGDVLAGGNDQAWRHPWFVQPEWAPQQGRWVATVKPGFVNAQTPYWRTTVREQKATGRKFDLNPLSGEPFFSADVFEQETEDAETVTIEIPLYFRPAITLPWRAVGFDGAANVAVPEFFLKRGAANSPNYGQESFGAGADSFDLSQLTAEAPAGLRLLRTCDLWLRQPRSALTSTIQITPSGLVTGVSLVQQQLGFRPADPNAKLQVMTGTFDAFLGGGQDALADDYEEPTWDDLQIARVWLLSPPDVEAGSEPDHRWQPYVQHDLFWNLNYEPRNFVVRAMGDASIPVIPPLAGGVATGLLNWMIASLNDAAQRALNILEAHSLKGTFWTPTGGGSTAVFPVEEVPATGATGADKSGRLRAEALAKARRNINDALDPVFPYRALPFNPTLLNPAA